MNRVKVYLNERPPFALAWHRNQTTFCTSLMPRVADIECINLVEVSTRIRGKKFCLQKVSIIKDVRFTAHGCSIA